MAVCVDEAARCYQSAVPLYDIVRRPAAGGIAVHGLGDSLVYTYGHKHHYTS
jgi:hypothetical protein